jgi:plastocyanin
MRSGRLAALILLFATLALAACGDGSDSETAAGGGEDTATAPAESAATTEGEDSGEAAAQDEERAPSGEAVRSAKVEIDGFAYVPQTVTVQAGGKVTWINRDDEEHTATLDDGTYSSGELAEGKLNSRSFKRQGTFAYHCELHPEMTGTVEVVEPS